MTKRKPLPYAACALLDEALMDDAEALRAATVLLKSSVTVEERYRLLGVIVHGLHEIANHIRAAKMTSVSEDS